MLNNRKHSILLSTVFILALLSSTIIAGSSTYMIQGILAQNPDVKSSHETPYSVRILAPATSTIKEQQSKSQQIDYTVQVTRENKKGQFVATLSTVSDTPALNLLRSFTPSFTVNMEEGVTAQNVTLTIPSPRADSLTPGNYKFQVQAVNLRSNDLTSNQIRTPVQALSNLAILQVVDDDAINSEIASSASKLKASHTPNTGSNSPAATKQQQQQAAGQQQNPKPNHPPVAMAGTNQQVYEGDIVILDAGTSSDADRGQVLSYIWEQVGSSVPPLRIEQPSANSPKAKFTAPQINEGNGPASYTIKLIVQDGNGGQATDNVGIVVVKKKQTGGLEEENNKVAPPTPPPTSPAREITPPVPSTGEEQGQKQKPESNIQNHPPTAQASSASTEINKPVKLSLHGSDTDKDDKLSFVISHTPSHATIAGFDKATGSLTYIPVAGFTGKDTIKYKVTDSKGAESNEASVGITVEASSLNFNKDSSSISSGNASATSVSSSSSVEDRVKQREELAAKIRETNGEKITNQYIVVLKKESLPTETQTLVDDAKERGAKVLQQYQRALKGFTVNIPNRETLDLILNDSDVAYVEPDVKVKAFAQTIPTGIDRIDADLSSAAASGDGKGEAVNVDIAILDTGIDLKHPDLTIFKHVTYVPETTTGNDDNGHGTMVAGIAAAKDNDWGSVGVAPGARLWSVKVLDSTGTGSLSSVLQGLDYVTSNAKDLEVADMSFGCENCVSETLNTAISNAISAGVTLVAAAGNNAKDASTFSPANHPDVIAVSAIADSDGKCGGQGDSTSAGADDSLASFSNYGAAIDMAAPGVQIYSTSKNGGYSMMSGTSMAAPHVAGAAALYLSENPDASPPQVLDALKNQASTSSTKTCDAKGHGYFSGDKDSIKEPLLYVGPGYEEVSEPANTPPSNNTSSNSTSNNNANTTSGSPSLPTGNANNNSNTTNTVPPPIPGNVTGVLGNGTALGNQTQLGNQTSPSNQTLANQTSGNQTYQATSGDTWYFIKKIGVGILNQPHGVDVDPATGKVYVADTGSHRIAAFNPDGTLDATFDTDGFVGDGPAPTFGNAGPEDLVVVPGPYGTDGKAIIATDPTSTTPALVYYDLSGNLISKITNPNLGGSNVRPFGIGTLESSGSYLVTDIQNRKVYRFDPQPVLPGISLHPFFPATISNPAFTLLTDAACCLSVTSGGTPLTYVTDNQNGFGTGVSWYSASDGSSVGSCCGDQASYGVDVIPGSGLAGRMVFSETVSSVVKSYFPDGGFAAMVAQAGSADGQVLTPRGVAVLLDQPGGDNTDTIYVAEHGNSRISVFANSPADTTAPPAPTLQSPANNYDIADTTPTLDWSDSADPSTPVTYDLLVDDNNDFSTPIVSQTGLTSSEYTLANLLVDGTYYWKVKPKDAAGNVGVFTSATQFIIDTSTPPADCIDRSGVLAAHTFITKWGSGGTANGQFTGMADVAIDAECNVYVADHQAGGGSTVNRIQKFSKDGTFITSWGIPGNDDGEFFFPGPTGIAIELSTGYVYVADTGNNRIQKFTRDGDFITKWGDINSVTPTGLAVDSDGNVYASEGGRHRINKFTSTGTFLFRWGAGVGPSTFNVPEDMAVDLSDNSIYVVDKQPNRIQKFDSNGNFITSWGNLGSGPGQFKFSDLFDNIIGIDVVNSQTAPSTGRVYVSDLGNHRVQLFEADGTYVAQFGTQGTANGQLSSPQGLAVDPNGNVYVADGGNSRVQVFTNSETITDTIAPTITARDPTPTQTDVSASPCVCITFSEPMDGSTIGSSTISVQKPDASLVAGQVSYDSVNKIASFNPAAPSAPLSYSTTYTVLVKGGASGVKDVAGNALAADVSWTFTTMPAPATGGDHSFAGKWGSDGLGISQFKQPVGVDVDPSTGDVYVADMDTHSIQKFKSDGTFVMKWGSGGPNNGQFGTQSPFDIAVDPNTGDVYATDWDLSRIQKFSSSGTFLTKWDSTGSGNGQFLQPTHIAVDSAGNVYVGEDGNDRIQKFSPSGTFLSKWGSAGTGDGQFASTGGPGGMDFDSSGNVYVADHHNNRIQKFSPSGAFLLKWDDGPGSGTWDVALDSQNNVYVSFYLSNQVREFAPNGASIVGTIGSGSGTGSGQFGVGTASLLGGPSGIAISPSTGNLYAADTGNRRVQFFGPGADSTGPIGTISLEGGAASTNSPTVSADLTCTDTGGSGCTSVTVTLADAGANIDPNNADNTKFHLSSTTDSTGKLFSALETGADTGIFVGEALLAPTPSTNSIGYTQGDQINLDYTFSPNSGTKTVEVFFEDGAANQSPAASDTINFDPGSCTPSSTGFADNRGLGTAAPGAADYSFIRKWGTSQALTSNFRQPTGSDVDSNCNVFVVDYGNNRLQKFASDGSFLNSIGNAGTGNGDFSNPQNIAIDSANNFYVADYANHRIQKFDSSGNFVTAWGSAGTGDSQFASTGGPIGIAVAHIPTCACDIVFAVDSNNNRIQTFEADGTFIAKWGTSGVGDSQFNQPWDIDVYPAGDGAVYVTDRGNNRVQKFTSTGSFIGKWGTAGSADGQFSKPDGVSADSNGNVFVSDENNRVQKFNSAGGFITKWGSQGSINTNTFEAPVDVSTDKSGNVYVSDIYNDRIQIFNNAGTFVAKWGIFSFEPLVSPNNIAFDPVNKIVYASEAANQRVLKFSAASGSEGGQLGRIGTPGAGNGQFVGPRGVAVNTASGDLFVVDQTNQRIQKFDSNGNFLLTFSTLRPSDSGSGTPMGIAVGGPTNNLIAVSDIFHHRIQVYDAAGNFVTMWGSNGFGNGQFRTPAHVAIDPAGMIYVADFENNEIKKFQLAASCPTGTTQVVTGVCFVKRWGSTGTGNGAFDGPSGITADSNGKIYVADSRNRVVQVFTNTGAFITKFGAQGANNGQFEGLTDLVVDPTSGDVYTAEVNNHRIQVFAHETVPPTIVNKYPTASGTGVSVTPCICILFKEKLDSSTVNPSTITLTDSGAQPVAGQVSYITLLNGSSVISFNPNTPLSYSSGYSAKVKGGAGGVLDQFGNPLTGDVTWSFTTMANPPPAGMHTFAGKWGSEGFGKGQFGTAVGMAIDPQTHDIYVADYSLFGAHNRIQKFGSDGHFITSFPDDDSIGSAPTGMAVDPNNGDVYVISSTSNIIKKYSSTGAFITMWGGTEGTGPGEFGPCCLHSTLDVDSAGNVYVADIGNDRVQKFSSTGTFITMWGSEGFGPGEFISPTGIAIDPSDNVYVLDGEGLSKFTSTGTFISKIDRNPSGYGLALDKFGNTYETDQFANNIRKFAPGGSSPILTWGGTGSGDGQFGNAAVSEGVGPFGIEVDDSTGNIYVMDTANHRVQVFGPDSTAPTVSATSPGNSETDVSTTPCVCITFSEEMTVSTINPNTIVLEEPDSDTVSAQISYNPATKMVSFNPTSPTSPLAYSTIYTATVKGGTNGVKDAAGNPLAADYTFTFTTMAQPPAPSNPHSFVSRWGVQGTGNGQFDLPGGSVVDSTGNLYVVDLGNRRIQKFSSDGTFVAKWGTDGTGDGQFREPQDVTVDSLGNVYVTDIIRNDVQKFSNTGTFISKWGSTGPNNGQFDGAAGISVDSNDNIYVAELNNNRVQKFSNTGTFLAKFGSVGNDDGQFNGAAGIALDSADNVFVSDLNNARIQKFTSAGTFVTSWGSAGAGDSQFTDLSFIGVDEDDNVYVADSGNNRIQKFSNTGAFMTKWGSLGSADGQFEFPSDVSVDLSTGDVFVTDTQNNRVQKFSPGSTTGSSTISIDTVNNETPRWDIDTVQADGTTTGSVSGDIVKVNWGDSSPVTTASLGPGGTWSATHKYGSAATGPKNIVAELVGSGGTGTVKATSAPFPVTVQKHTTSLSISVPSPIAQDSSYTVSGVLKDTSYSENATGNDVPITGGTITFSGSTPAISSVVTGSVSFSQPGAAPFQVSSCAACPSDKGDGSDGNKLLRLNAGGEITLPPKTFNIGMTFDESVANPQFVIEVTLSDSSVKTFTNPRYLDVQFPTQATKIKLVSVGGSTTTGSIGIANLVTGDVHGFPQDQYTIDFENLAVGQNLANPLVVNPGTFYAIGRSPSSGTTDQTVQASFAGSAPYLQSTSSLLTYKITEKTSSFGGGTSGEGATTVAAYDGDYFNQPSTYFGSGLTTNSLLCTKSDPDGTGSIATPTDPDGTGPATAGDTDNDGICDIWETSNTAIAPWNGNTQRFITCPMTSTGTLIDVTGGTTRALDCTNTNQGPYTANNPPSPRYNLCFNDKYANVWAGKSENMLVCPTVGHKDIFVEIDFMANHDPDDKAIKDVIMAFGNAPITGQAQDAFGRTQGITLHVIEDEQLSEVIPITVWKDSDTNFNNDFDGIKNGNPTIFTDGHFGFNSDIDRDHDGTGTGSVNGPGGVINEHTGTDAAKILNMKHYVYRYGLFVHTWGACPGAPSGIGEILGNDFIVSLGCGFDENPPTNSHAGSEGSRSQQAGTFMHELGHTLNLKHGGAAIGAIGSTDFEMNCKANYLSVMNYARQFPNQLKSGAATGNTYDDPTGTPNTALVTTWEGVRSKTAGSTLGDPLPAGSGSQTWPGSSLDYSRYDFAPLSEASLNEASGVRKADNTAISPPEKIVFGPLVGGSTSEANTGLTVNWNLDADSADTAVARDLNNVAVPTCGSSVDTQKSYNDWNNLKLYMLHDDDAQDGAVTPESKPSNNPELTAVIVQKLKASAPQQFAGVLPPPNQDGSTVVKPGSTVPIKLQLRDINNNLIKTAKLKFTAQKLPGSTPFVAPDLFKYDKAKDNYVYNWNSPAGTTNQGTWVIRVYQDYGTADQRLLQGPQPPTATGETVRLSLKS